jgi:FtsH-binding integral membrane protein
MSRGLEAYATPVRTARPDARAAYLQRVAAWTAGGLLIAAVTGTFSAVTIAATGLLAANQWVVFAVIMGLFFVSNTVARGMVHGGAKVGGFVLGTAAMGAAMGFLLLAAVVVSAGAYGDTGVGPFVLIGQAGGATLITGLSMTAWLASGPKDLSMVGAALRILWLPMLVLMVVSFVFPLGGVFGLAVSAVFVVVSGLGLVYNLNQVVHVLNTDQHIEGGYEIALGLLVLFWNLLSLLMRLTDRR